MRYALLVYQDETAVISDEERSRRDAALAAFQEDMHEHGGLLGGELLHPAATAATVRCWDGGDVIVADGPPARPTDARPPEQLAGFFIVDGQDLDEAITMATRVPAAWYGTVEVRPTRGA
jgi:hypothetical protein